MSVNLWVNQYLQARHVVRARAFCNSFGCEPDIQPPSSRFSKSIGHQHVLEPELRIGKGAHVFLGKVGSDLQKPDGLVVITKENLSEAAPRLCRRSTASANVRRSGSKAVDTCLPVDKVMSIDEMACRLMGD